MSRAVALLTLDSGSVLYNPAQMPEEVILKHQDGELVKIHRDERGEWLSQRRQEYEVNFSDDGKYSSSVTAAATLADRQAFGFRLNGEPVNPLSVNSSHERVGTVEIESLDLGGIVVEDEPQLPFAVYTTGEIYYRIYITEEQAQNNPIARATSILQKREGPRGDWETIARSEPTEPGYLLKTIADETEMETVSGSANEMREVIEDQQELFASSRSDADEEIREQMAIQNKTSFPPVTPKPRPITFPTHSSDKEVS